jgi:pre-mRNA-splicing factor ATP-dependent RNA helicase DHX38/PRP16
MMNLVNPNDILAQRVVDIARGNRSGDAFCKGELLPPPPVFLY